MAVSVRSIALDSPEGGTSLPVASATGVIELQIPLARRATHFGAVSPSGLAIPESLGPVADAPFNLGKQMISDRLTPIYCTTNILRLHLHLDHALRVLRNVPPNLKVKFG